MPDPLDPEEFILVDPADYPIAASAIANQAQLGEGRHAQDLRLDHLAERSGGQRRRHPQRGRQHRRDRRTRPSPRTAPRPSGGGLYTEGGTVTVTGSTISKNQAANGGGLYSGGHVSQYGLRGTFTVKNSQVFENTAENGGGLYNDGDAQLVVTDTTFTRNHSSDHGAAIASEGRVEHDADAASRSTENESNGEGGGVWTAQRAPCRRSSTRRSRNNKAGVPIVEEDGTLSDDIAGGGGLHTDGGPVTVRNSTFDGNEATEEGGGLSLNNAGDVLIVDTHDHEQPRVRRRRPGEQRHRGHVPAGDWSRATGPRARAAASTTPRAASSTSSTRRSAGTAASSAAGSPTPRTTPSSCAARSS